MSDLIHSNKKHRIFINSEFADSNTNFTYNINPPLIGVTKFKINQVAIPIDNHTFSDTTADERTIQINIDEGSNQNQLIAVEYSDSINYTLDTFVQLFSETSITNDVVLQKSATKNGTLEIINNTTNHLKLVKFPPRLTDKLSIPAQIDAAHHFFKPSGQDDFIVAFESTDSIYDVDHFTLEASRAVPGQPSVLNSKTVYKRGQPIYTQIGWETFFLTAGFDLLPDQDLRLSAGAPQVVQNLGSGNYTVQFRPSYQVSTFERQWRLRSFDREGNEVRDLSGMDGNIIIIPANTSAGSLNFSVTFKLEERKHTNYYGTHTIATFSEKTNYTITEIVNIINTGLSTLALTYPTLGFTCSNSGDRLVFQNVNTANFTTAYGMFTVSNNSPLGLPNALYVEPNQTLQAPNDYVKQTQVIPFVTPILDFENLNRVSYIAMPNLVTSSRCGMAGHPGGVGHRSFVKSIFNSGNNSFGGYLHYTSDSDTPFEIGVGTNIIDKIQVEVHSSSHTIKKDSGLATYLELDFF